MWKFIRDVYTVSYFVTGYGNLYETLHILRNRMWKFIKDVYTVSYFVTGCRSL